MKYSNMSKNSEDSASLLEILKFSHLSLVFCEVVHLHSRESHSAGAHILAGLPEAQLWAQTQWHRARQKWHSLGKERTDLFLSTMLLHGEAGHQQRMRRKVTSGGSQLVWIGKGRARQVRNSVLLFELHYSSLHLQLGTEEQFVFTVDIFLGSETITYTQNKGNNHKCDL